MNIVSYSSSSSDEDTKKEAENVEFNMHLRNMPKIVVNPNREYIQPKVHLLSPAENYRNEIVSSNKIELPESSFWTNNHISNIKKTETKEKEIEPKRMRMDKFDGGLNSFSFKFLKNFFQ